MEVLQLLLSFFVQFFHVIWAVCIEVAVDMGTDPVIVAAIAGAIVARAMALLATFALPPPLGPIVASVIQLGIPKLLTRFAAVVKARQAKKVGIKLPAATAPDAAAAAQKPSGPASPSKKDWKNLFGS